MRFSVISSAIILAASVSLISNYAQDVDATANVPSATAANPDISGEGLIVHEWGTFTSFSGSDGVRLEFRPLADEDLPPFVLDRFLQAGIPHPFTKSQLRVRLRMETPITYFYTERERDVNVRVRFPQGLLTEFYPPVARMQPKFTFFEKPELKDSMLDWGKIHLIPTNRFRADVEDTERRLLLESLLASRLAPESDPKFHYGHARETDSALIHVHKPKPSTLTPLAPTGDFFEKFLFYRGVGNFDLPLKLTAASSGSFELTNLGTEPIRSLFLVDTDKKSIRFAAYDQIGAGERMQFVQSAEPTTVDALAEAVTAALIKEGLYEKEAHAMVNTWRSSWFGEKGTRLFYVVPSSLTDAVLPLEIYPQPQETVRVLVGRMEVMTPEQESQVATLIKQSAAERFALTQRRGSAEAKLYTGPAELRDLGRLVEPALARVRIVSQDSDVRHEARLLLQQFTGNVVAGAP